MRAPIRYALGAVAAALSLPVLVAVALLSRFRRRPHKTRLVWGSVPIVNNTVWARAMRRAGYPSETFTTDHYSIHRRDDWDRIASEEFAGWPARLIPYAAFASALLRYDIFFLPFSGFFIGETPLAQFQHVLFRIARKKVVALPFGSDAYVYRRVRSLATVHALLLSYPRAGRMQARVAQDLDYWIRWADCVIPGLMGFDGFGRWDVLVPSPLYIDLGLWRRRVPYTTADGFSGEVVVVHAPNHRGFKGTEFVVAAVEQLQSEGLRVRLLLLEGKSNEEVRRVLTEEADILVEQLVFTGHAFNGLEGMASGVATVANLEDDADLLPFRRWAYFDECPIVSASPETIVKVLRRLVVDASLRTDLGRSCRAYAEKYHGFDSAQFLFSEVLAFVLGERQSLLNLFHPLTSEHVRRLPKVTHPLVRNRLPS